MTQGLHARRMGLGTRSSLKGLQPASCSSGPRIYLPASSAPQRGCLRAPRTSRLESPAPRAPACVPCSSLIRPSACQEPLRHSGLFPVTLHIQPPPDPGTLPQCLSSTWLLCPPPWLSVRPGHVPHLGCHISLLTALSASTLFFAYSQPGSRTWFKCKSFPPFPGSDL